MDLYWVILNLKKWMALKRILKDQYKRNGAYFEKLYKILLDIKILSIKNG